MSTSSNECHITIGIDDGMFLKGKSKWTVLVGVLFVGLKLEKIAMERVEVDGLNGTSVAWKILNRLEVKPGATVFLDGITYAGFNFIDPVELSEKSFSHVIAVFRRRPNEERILRALKLHFLDWEIRWKVISKVSTGINEMNVRGRKLYYYSYPNSYEAKMKIRKIAVTSKIPEPLRLADALAKEVGKFLITHL